MIKTPSELRAKITTCEGSLKCKFEGTNGKRALIVCGGTGCLSSNAAEIIENFEKAKKHYTSFNGLTVAVLGLTYSTDSDEVKEHKKFLNDICANRKPVFFKHRYSTSRNDDKNFQSNIELFSMLESGKSISLYLPPKGIEPRVLILASSGTFLSCILEKIIPTALIS